MRMHDSKYPRQAGEDGRSRPRRVIAAGAGALGTAVELLTEMATKLYYETY